MRLVELQINALPGVEEPYSLGGLSDQVTVVVGPNSSGKSSLVRALTALLTPQLHAGELVDVSATFEEITAEGVTEWRGRRLGPHVSWHRGGETSGPPPTPQGHLLSSYLISLETLMAPGATDTAIANRISKELSGGYDLKAVRAALKPQLTGLRSAARELAAGEKRQQELQRVAEDLRARVAARGEVRERLREANATAALEAKYARATELVEQLAELAGAQARLAQYAPPLALIKGDEFEQLNDLTSKAEAARQQHLLQETALRTARAELAETGIDLARHDGVTAKEAEREAGHLAECAAKADALEQETYHVLARLGLLSRKVTVTEVAALPKPPPTLETLDEVERLFGERLAVRAELHAAETEVRTLEGELEKLEGQEFAEGSDDALGGAELRDAQGALASWLATPVPAAPRNRKWPLAFLGTSAVLFSLSTWKLLGGGELTEALPQRVWEALVAADLLQQLLAGGAVLALLTGLLLLLLPKRAAPLPVGQLEAETMFGRTGALPPLEWEHARVAERLEGLLTEGTDRADRTRQRTVTVERLSKEKLNNEVVAERLESVDGRLRELAEAHGFPDIDGRLGASFAEWLRSALEVSTLNEKLRGLHFERRHLERRAEGHYGTLFGLLDGTPHAPAGRITEPVNFAGGKWVSSRLPFAPGLKVAAEKLTDSVTRAREVASKVASADEALKGAARQMAELEAERARLLERLSVDPADPQAAFRVSELVSAAPHYRAAHAELDRLEGAVEANRSALRDSPELMKLAEAGDLLTLEEGLERARAAGEERDAAAHELGALENELGEAQRKRELWRANAEVQQALDSLQGHLRHATGAALTDLLLDDVTESHHATRRPVVLANAQEWFARFTHYGFALEFDTTAEGGGELRVRDTASNRLLTVEQLSTGTRAQLLLALRVAHAAHAEGEGMKLPFFLDEALSTADATRFTEVANALLELSQRNSRQVIYLSVRESDATAWEQAARGLGLDVEGGAVRVVSLATLRGVSEESLAELVARLPDARSGVPDPTTTPPLEFAKAVGVRPVDPWAELTEVHPFHLWWGDLQPVRKLALVGIDTLGQALELTQRSERSPLTEAEAITLKRRAAGLRAWQAAWRWGRSRPLTEEALTEAAGLSDSFLPQVAALLGELEGDAAALLAALEEGKVSHFRKRAVDELRDWLVAGGYLPTQPPEAERARILLTATALAEAAGGMNTPSAARLDEAATLVRRLEAALVGKEEPA